MVLCELCKKHISLSSHLVCGVCKGCVHIKCFSKVNKYDALYSNTLKSSWICSECTGNIFPFNHIKDDIEFRRNIKETF